MIAIDPHPSARMLRGFSATWLLFCVAVGFWLARHSVAGPASFAVWAVGGVGGTLGLAAPRAMRWPYLALAYASYPVGLLVSTLLLGLIYFGVLTPIGLWLRLRGRDPLDKRIDRSARSYWQKRTPTKLERYFDQY